MKRFTGLLLLVLVSLLFVTAVYAEVKLDYGATFRLRQEIWNDVVSFKTVGGAGNNDFNYFRLRIQAWGKADINKDMGAYLRLTTEPRYWTGPFKLNAAQATATYTNIPDPYERLDENELLVDNLYFDYKNAFGLPVDIRIGRQDFLGPEMYGEGFLLLDGTPGDGSRTFFFNAARARWRITQKNSVDLVYIDNRATDTYLPSLHPSQDGPSYIDHKLQLNVSNEHALVLYSRNKINSLTVEPYYIYKTEQTFGTTPHLNLHTFGARAVYDFGSGWKAGAEYAHQTGEYTGGRDRSANGGYIFVNKKVDSIKTKPEFDLRYVYLSGDDPNSAKNEAWDPLFSRAPYWNELLIYSLRREQSANTAGIHGYWTNMEIYKAAVKLFFTPQTNLGLSYQLLRAPERSNVAGTYAAMFSNSGKFRGHMVTGLLGHEFSKKVDGYLQYEYFMPNNYYTSAARNATFFRWQLQVKL